MSSISAVCVYCASSSLSAPIYVQAAQELGLLLAKHNLKTICGAGQTGLMAALANSAMTAGGLVEGIVPKFMCEQPAWVHKHLSNLIVTNTMHQRKELMAMRSDGCIALPGGCGTLEELLEIITWKQLGLYVNPIIILNIDGYYDPLIEMLQRCIHEQFMRPEHEQLWQIAQTPEHAIQLLYTTPKTTIQAIANAAL